MPESLTADQNLVFLSHSHHDVAFCSRLAQDLRGAGFVVWTSEDSKRISDTIPASVSVGLADSRSCVALISAHALESNWVKHEVHTAMHRKLSNGDMNVFVALLENIEYWPKELELLSPLPQVAFYNDQTYDTGLAQLISGLREQQERTASPQIVEHDSTAEIVRLKAHTGPTLCVRSSHDGHFVASGGGDGVICLWDRTSQRRVRAIQATPQSAEWIRALAWSPDDSQIVAVHDSQVAFVWNVEDGTLEGEIQYPSGDLLDVTWTDSSLGFIMRSGWVGMCSLTLGGSEHALKWHTELQIPLSPALVACWQPSRLDLAVATQDGRIYIGDPRARLSAVSPASWPRNADVAIRALQWSFDGTKLGALYANGQTTILDVIRQEVIHDWKTGQKTPRGLYWIGPSGLLAVSDSTGIVKKWCLEPLQEDEAISIPNVRILDIASHPKDGNICIALATGELCFL